MVIEAMYVNDTGAINALRIPHAMAQATTLLPNWGLGYAMLLVTGVPKGKHKWSLLLCSCKWRMQYL